MRDLISKIWEKFAATKPENLSQEYSQKCLRDIGFILDYLPRSKERFLPLYQWQSTLNKILGLDLESYHRLLEVIASQLDPEESSSQISLLNMILSGQIDLEPFKKDSSAQDIIHFHIHLFEKIDPAALPAQIAILERDYAYIQDFLERSSKEGDPDFFIRFIAWLEQILEPIGFESVSLIRFLTTIRLFSAEALHPNLDLAIQKLVAPAPLWEATTDNLKQEILDLHIGLFGDIEKTSSLTFKAKISADLNRHIEFLQQAIDAKSEILFVEYAKWVASVLDSIGVPTISLIRFLGSMRLVISESEIDKKLKDGIPFLDKAIKSLIVPNKNAKEAEQKTELSLAKKYMKLLLAGKRKEATDFVMAQLDEGMSIRDIYMEIFQASQYEIGRLWEINEISVAQEHYCTATTQMIMSMLYPHIFANKPSAIGKNIVATCVGSELHEIGVRMVSDFLEMEGWDTYYLGANTPVEAILVALEDYNAKILALSVTLTPHIKNAQKIIQTIKAKNPDVKILVGGYPFLQDENLWSTIGADGFARSAKEVHQTLLNLVD